MGVCETDFSGYPDCRDDTIKAMQVALNLGMDTRFVVHTPLMWLDKARTWTLAEQEGGSAFVELVRTTTHTCYIGDRSELHDWGYGCGQLSGMQAPRTRLAGLCSGQTRGLNRTSVRLKTGDASAPVQNAPERTAFPGMERPDSGSASKEQKTWPSGELPQAGQGSAEFALLNARLRLLPSLHSFRSHSNNLRRHCPSAFMARTPARSNNAGMS